MATKKSTTSDKHKKNTHQTNKRKSSSRRFFKRLMFRFFRFLGVKDLREGVIIFILCMVALSAGFIGGIYVQWFQEDQPPQQATVSNKPVASSQKIPVPLDIKEKEANNVLKNTDLKPYPHAQSTSKSRDSSYQRISPMENRPHVLQQHQRSIVAAKAHVVIIIDDMGVDVKHSSMVLKRLPPPLTLSYLPYAQRLPRVTEQARQLGHELMVHIPMEPMDQAWALGPRPLMTSDPPERVRDNLEWSMSQFDGYVAINNHMGSKFTSDKEAMAVVMAYLRGRGIIFVDSVTSPKSVAYQMARDSGIPALKRDVFLDHIDNRDYVLRQLEILEEKALSQGYAIAIGHPRAATIDALEEWLPQLKEKGIKLVPLSDLVKR